MEIVCASPVLVSGFISNLPDGNSLKKYFCGKELKYDLKVFNSFLFSSVVLFLHPWLELSWVPTPNLTVSYVMVYSL